jgi:hypothetical protein
VAVKAAEEFFMAKHYTFWYKENGKSNSEHLYVNTDEKACKKLSEFLAKKPGRHYIPRSLEMTERRVVPYKAP